MAENSDAPAESGALVGAVARQQLFDIASDSSMDHETKCQHLLSFGCEYLGLENGHVVTTNRDDNTHEVIIAAGTGLVAAGEQRQLEETYCHFTLDRNEPMTVFRDMPPGERPAQAEAIASYVGSTLVVAGEVWGTLCFVDSGSRPATTTADRAFVDLLSQWIGRLLERHQYEETLATKRDRFELFVEELTDYAMFMLDTEGHIDSWNHGAQLLQGYEEEKILGEHFAEFCTQEVSEQDIEDQWLAVAERTGRTEYEDWCVRQDGSQYRALVTITALYDDGEIRGFGVVMRDVTERERQRSKLEDEQEFVQHALDTLDDIFFVVTPAGNIDRVNQRAIEVTGHSRDDLTGMDPADLFAAEDSDTFNEAIADVLSTGEARMEATLLTVDGERRRYEFRARRLLDNDGAVTGIAGIGRDITEQELDEERLEVAQRILRHNLRNDLNAIRSWAETLDDGAAADQEAVERIIQVTDRLVDLSEKTRAMVQLESKRTDRRRADICTILPSLIEEYRTESADATIEYEPADASELAVTDGERFKTAVTNVIENALEHCTGTPQIRVVAETTGEYVRVHVHDNGPGIPSGERRVLEAGEETALKHGSGVGLWLIQWSVATMGGEVTFSERDPRGSIVTLTIPLASS